MNNMKNINAHNKKIINPPKDNITWTCNCIRKHQCPLNEKCLTNNVLHKASIAPNEENSKKKFIIISETVFKLRYANDKKTYNNIKYQTDTELSNEYWNIISAIKLRTCPRKFWEPINHTTKVLRDVSNVSMKSRQLLYTKTTC